MRNVASWRRRHVLLLDVIFVTVLLFAVLGASRLIFFSNDLPSVFAGIRTTFYGAASAGSAALLGFVITTATLTDAVVQGPKWDEFRASRAYAEVQDIYFNTIRWLGISSLGFLMFLVVDTDKHPQLVCEIVSLWILGVLTTRLYRSIEALEILLRTNSYKVIRPQ